MRDARSHAPATDRNRDPILDVLRDVLSGAGTVLEIASGTGQHAVYFASRLSGITWQPSDPDPGARRSIEAWTDHAAAERVLPPLELDVTAEPWPVDHADAIVNINMIHISPWACCQALMRGAARLLPEGGVLYLYGPYARGGRHTAPSNESFDRSLRMRDPSWGVRDLEDVVGEAATRGLAHERTVEMPANNLSVVFRKG